MQPQPEPLPIDPHLPEIGAALDAAGALVLTAPPGAGKTTRIPPFLHLRGTTASGEILVLEPRRLAARMGALRVAAELGERPGRTVGYSIRFDTVAGPHTRIRFLTEAVLVRQMLEDPDLEGVGTVILDEFHERSLATDLALALLRRLQRRVGRPRLLVMSATMDPQPVAAFLDGAPVIALGETRYDLDISYEEKIDRRPLEKRVAGAVLGLFRSGLEGDILVFLPGAAEIRRAAAALRPTADRLGLRIQPLHGDLPAGEQALALQPGDAPRVILSTNVAETSITIPGIGAVVDSGLARISAHSAWSGRPTLTTARISKSSAAQRAGRAGRTRSGRVVRLYTRHDFLARPDADPPEIRRADLAEALLALHGAGIRDTGDFPWFEPPPQAALDAARRLLTRLGAVDSSGLITDSGRRMLRFPVHPRIARMIVEGEALGVGRDAALLAALLGERDIRLDARAGVGGAGGPAREPASGPSDLLELIDRFREAETARFVPERLRELGLDPRAVAAARQAFRQIGRLSSGGAGSSAPPGEREEALLLAILRAFPDRVARRRRPHARELLLAGGGSARLSDRSVVRTAPFLVAVDIEERLDPVDARAAVPLVRLASAVEISGWPRSTRMRWRKGQSGCGTRPPGGWTKSGGPCSKGSRSRNRSGPPPRRRRARGCWRRPRPGAGSGCSRTMPRSPGSRSARRFWPAASPIPPSPRSAPTPSPRRSRASAATGAPSPNSPPFRLSPPSWSPSPHASAPCSNGKRPNASGSRGDGWYGCITNRGAPHGSNRGCRIFSAWRRRRRSAAGGCP